MSPPPPSPFPLHQVKLICTAEVPIPQLFLSSALLRIEDSDEFRELADDLSIAVSNTHYYINMCTLYFVIPIPDTMKSISLFNVCMDMHMLIMYMNM